MLKQVQIRNFKSIKELDIAPKRVNVFIGKPNVGKSNILEALSLFCAGYDKNGFLKPFIRMNTAQDLFHRKNLSNNISVHTDRGNVNIAPYNDKLALVIDPEKALTAIGYNSFNNNDYNRLLQLFSQAYEEFNVQSFFELASPRIFLFDIFSQLYGSSIQFGSFSSKVFKYDFKEFPTDSSPIMDANLYPPYGENIVSVLQSHEELLDFFAEIFKDEYNLDLIVRSPENTLEAHIKEGRVTNSIPMNLIADTLQRLIFYLTAIQSNEDSVLLLEEPETHSFPPYTNMLADRIAKSKTNQFFITTHSPYLLNTLLDETPKEEIAVFVTGYENHQTTLRQLTEEELSHALEYGIDLFYNYEKYMK